MFPLKKVTLGTEKVNTLAAVEDSANEGGQDFMHMTWPSGAVAQMPW
jgi:hypothetical protein